MAVENSNNLDVNLADRIRSAEIRLPSADVNSDLEFFTAVLGFQLEEIFPADDPASILLSGYGLRLRLQQGATEAPGTLRLYCDDFAELASGNLTELCSPSGTRIELVQAVQPLQCPDTKHAFVVRRLRDKAPWVIGRAGMHYRDLIPDRLGGSIIASHIRIPNGGPVPDMVHYHTVGFQLIYCYKGWVDVVYEDQGPTIRLTPGDCVTQPPQIRHRVLQSSDNLEVIEIGVPAEHITTIDHDMSLPNKVVDRARVFDGQTFVHHKVAQCNWQPWRIAGFEHRDTGINKGTDGVANVQVARIATTTTATNPVAANRMQNNDQSVSHNSDILFTFVLQGTMALKGCGESYNLSAGDAFVVPPHEPVFYQHRSADLELLEVSLPGKFDTVLNGSAHGDGIGDGNSNANRTTPT